MADILNDAIAAADGHQKIAQVKLFEAQNMLEMLKGIADKIMNLIEPPLPKTRGFDLAAVWTGLAILVTIAVLFVLRRSNLHVTGGEVISSYLNKIENVLIGHPSVKQVIERSTPIVPGDFTVARFLQWPTIVLCPMILVALVSSAYLLIVNPAFGQLLQKISVFGLSAVRIGLILLISLIAVAGFTSLAVIFGPSKIKETLKNVLDQFLKLMKLHKNNEEYVKNEIKASIGKFEELKKNLNQLKSRQINQTDAENIKSAIKIVQSMKENLMKSEKINKEDKATIQSAIETATVAAKAIEKIIGNWLLDHPVILN